MVEVNKVPCSKCLSPDMMMCDCSLPSRVDVPIMNTSQEIERKFLLNCDLVKVLKQYHHIEQTITQSYLPDGGEWTIRLRHVVRTATVDRFYLTLKKKICAVSCIEIETEIDRKAYTNAAAHAGPKLCKRRFVFRHEGHTWEIDHFLNPEFNNLVVAEIELDSIHETFATPTWLGKEVTHERKYKNAKMVKQLKAQSQTILT